MKGEIEVVCLVKWTGRRIANTKVFDKHLEKMNGYSCWIRPIAVTTGFNEWGYNELIIWGRPRSVSAWLLDIHRADSAWAKTYGYPPYKQIVTVIKRRLKGQSDE